MTALDATPSLPIGALYTKDVSMHGFAISNASIDDLAEAARMINRLLDTGQLRSRTAATYRLDEAAKAHQQMGVRPGARTNRHLPLTPRATRGGAVRARPGALGAGVEPAA